MRKTRALEDLRTIAASQEFLDVRSQEFPYRSVALAVVDLRGRLGLTQQGLADLVGTSQSVIGRVESGKHPVEVRLLSRIASATNEPLIVAFGQASEANSLDEPSPRVPSIPAEPPATYQLAVSGDDLLDSFNQANTSRDFAKARRFARLIGADPSSPRRRLALALDAYNRRQFEDAAKWAAEAFAGELPPISRDTALLVRARSLINLERARAALKALHTLGPDSALGWLVPAARADAYVELDDPKRALTESAAALALAHDDPTARFHAARTAWHADRVWEALDHVSVFRATDPGNLDGLLLHGSILGYLGMMHNDQGAYEAALIHFRHAMSSGDCEAIRLSALTAAHLGRWKEAFRVASKFVRDAGEDGPLGCSHTDPGPGHRHHLDAHILPAAFEALGESDPAEIERAVADAERRFGASRFLASQRALARALRGDLDGTLGALGCDARAVPTLPSSDQVAVAAANFVRGDFTTAFDILRHIENDLRRPEGLLRLAECAAAAGKIADARRVISKLADEDDAAGETARVALAIERGASAGARAGTRVTGGTDFRWVPVVGEAPSGSARESIWEGRHHRTTPMLDSMSNRHLVH